MKNTKKNNKTNKTKKLKNNENIKKEKNIETENIIEHNHTYKDSLRELIPYAVIILTVVLIRTFLITPIKVNGTSMKDTLEHGDTMILNKISMKINGIKRFQIVVIETEKSYLIKRVIGMPGETIEYKDGKLYINDKEINDPYYKNNTLDFDKVKVPEGYYFVMGDNRGDSMDSRIIGPINGENILGTTKLIIFPISDIGIAK